ncbi:MAG: hypothetical protein HC802_04305 [Caldilineaceae bacterium]|nr:hypothetical protein [Caldilineaceae bacterium]
MPEYYVVIGHDDPRSDLLLPELFPNATVQQEFQDFDGQPYARIYVRPAESQPDRAPQHLLETELGDGISLIGFDVQPDTLTPGADLYLQLYWQTNRQPTADWTVFTHVLGQDAAGNPVLVAGKDSPPGEGSLVTTRWQAGWQVLDEYKIALPADLLPGEYALEIGLYQHDGPRLPAQGSGLNLGKIQIE